MPPAAAGNRPELHKLLSQLRKGDVLVVWTLDRLSRSLRDVLTIMERVQERHAGFRSLKEAVDTTTPAGRMMMQMVGAFAEFERAMLKERTKAGLDAARKEGRIGGRPPKLKPHQQQEIVTLVKQGKKTPPTRRACSASTRQRCRGYSGGPGSRSSVYPSGRELDRVPRSTLPEARLAARGCMLPRRRLDASTGRVDPTRPW